MATKCKACGGQARKGSGGMASVLVDGKIVAGRVCGACMGKAVVVVAASVAQCVCGEKASLCSGCVAAAVDKAKRGAADAPTLAKALRKRAKAYENANSEHGEGIGVGLEQAAGFLEKGVW